MAVINGTDVGETLNGTDGNDTINAMGGNDIINFSVGIDVLNGGAGFDTVLWNSNLFTLTSFVNLTYNAGTNQLVSTNGLQGSSTLNSVEQINIVTYAGPGQQPDNFIDLRGFTGPAQVYAYGGDDTVYTANSGTYVQTGEGDDEVYITGADNVIFGEAGDDTFVLLEGTGLNNQIYGGAGFDTLDATQINAQNVIPYQIIAGDFEQLFASDIGETWFGGDEDNIYYGNGGNDVLRTQGGDDQLFGGDGDDLLEGGEGVDFFDGGAGLDRVSFDFVRDTATQGVVADLRTQTILNDGFGNTETLVSIEGLGAGTSLADTFDGDKNDNVLFAGAGDTVRGHRGDDIVVIQSEGSAALVQGGAGSDTLSFIFGPRATWTQGVTVDLGNGTIISQNPTYNATGFENINSTLFDDSLRGTNGDNNFFAIDGNDTILARGGNDTVDAGAGNERGPDQWR